MSGRKITNGLREAIAHAQGRQSRVRVKQVRVPEEVNVRALRERLNLSQREFALRFGFSLACVRNWEQHRRFPDGASRVLLKVIEHNPESVEQALAVS